MVAYKLLSLFICSIMSISPQAGQLTVEIFAPIIQKAGDLFGKTYGQDEHVDTALRINADHVRATAFLINDGIMPSNEGRGYVLRKIMRRAMRNARRSIPARNAERFCAYAGAACMLPSIMRPLAWPVSVVNRNGCRAGRQDLV